MNLTGRQRQDDAEINLTPLIDVVFTLIIFFVVTTTFENRTALQVALPEATAETLQRHVEPLLVVVDQDGRYFVGANEVLNPDATSLRHAIERAAGEDRERPVVIRADASASHQSVVTAMDVLGQLGFVRLQLATTSPAKAAAE